MRKYLIFGMLALAFGCSQPSGYKIEVKLDGATGQVILEQREGGNFVPKDTAEIVNGIAVLEGKVEFPEMYYLNVAGLNQRAILFVENTKMKVSGHVDSLRNIKITGSPVNDEYLTIKSELDKTGEAGMLKYREYQKAMESGDTLNAPRIMEEVKSIFDGQDLLMKNFVKTKTASYVTPFFLNQLQQTMETEALDSIVNALDPKLDVIPSVIALKERILKLKRVAIGQVAPDFTQNDPDGKPIRLSDVYAQNTYTLIDFWASWCGPCRMENPNIVAVFNDYKAKGFGVFGVSLDRDKSKWVEGIEADKLTWPHVSDLKFWQSEAAALYGISAIPANILVDKQGIIVARNLREQALRDKIAELLP